MRKKSDSISIILAAITLLLLPAATVCLAYDYRQNRLDFTEHPGVIILPGLIPVLLIQILVLFRSKPEPGGTILFADLDAQGIPENIFEVPEKAVLQFCRDEFHMDYRIEYWPSLRSRLLAIKQKESQEGRIAEQLLERGKTIADGNYVVHLEYIDKQGKQAMLYSLTNMPTAAEGAIEIIRNNFFKTWIFRNAYELVIWEYELSEQKRPLFRAQVDKFLRKKAKKLD